MKRTIQLVRALQANGTSIDHVRRHLSFGKSSDSSSSFKPPKQPTTTKTQSQSGEQNKANRNANKQQSESGFMNRVEKKIRSMQSSHSDQKATTTTTTTTGGRRGSPTSSRRSDNKMDGRRSVSLDRSRNRFTLDLGDNRIARIDFKTIGENRVDMYHTEVPHELRGQGIGRKLADGAFQVAADNHMKVKLSCSYLVDYMNRHADQKSRQLLLDEKDTRK